MSDLRTRALEAAAQRGEPGAAEALARALCRSGAHRPLTITEIPGAPGYFVTVCRTCGETLATGIDSRSSWIGVAVEALPQGEPVRVVVDPPSPTAT